MRELRFTIRFEPGLEPIMDACIEHPGLRGHAMASCVRRDRYWSVERFVGPPSAIEQVEHLRFDTDGDGRGPLGSTDGTERHHDRLERSPTSIVVYTFVERLHTANSVPALAARHLDLGHLFKFRRREQRQKWRLFMLSDENVDVFYEALADQLPDGARIHMGRLGELEQWDFDSLATVSLPIEQRETLRAAVEHGYYETPREVTIDELAAILDVPQSTVSYRLRQAEAQLAKGYLHRSGDRRDDQFEHSPAPDA